MTRITATFQFTEKYRDRNFTYQNASVTLEINYSTKTFSVIPNYGKDVFDFKNNSHQWAMWKAVVKAIDSAIDFANVEVGNTSKVENKEALNQYTI